MLKIIKGGLPVSHAPNIEFKNAKMTNTRLMGAVYVYAHWQFKDCAEQSFHQFFHIDTEEYGVESYEYVWGDDQSVIEELEESVAGFLGGTFVSISEDEFVYIVKEAIEKNNNTNNYLEVNYENLSFILGRKMPSLNVNELIGKQSEEITTENQLINYFVMRCLGRDFKVAETLCLENNMSEILEKIFNKIEINCMNRNRIYKVNSHNNLYRCEALAERNGKYTIFNLALNISNLKVVSIEIIGEMKITEVEAAFILRTEEYIAVYSFVNIDYLLEKYMALSFGKTITEYPNGTMIMYYSDNNNHVHNQIFNIRDDIIGGIFVSDIDQFVIFAPTLEMNEALEKIAMKYSENQLKESEEAEYSRSKANERFKIKDERFHLNRSIILDFAHAEGYTFNEYLEEFNDL